MSSEDLAAPRLGIGIGMGNDKGKRMCAEVERKRLGEIEGKRRCREKEGKGQAYYCTLERDCTKLKGEEFGNMEEERLGYWGIDGM